MPNMSHRAPTLNSVKETSRKSFSFWQSVIVKALRNYLCATVHTVCIQYVQHTHTHRQTHASRQTQTKKIMCLHQKRHIQTDVSHVWGVCNKRQTWAPHWNRRTQQINKEQRGWSLSSLARISFGIIVLKKKEQESRNLKGIKTRVTAEKSITVTIVSL